MTSSLVGSEMCIRDRPSRPGPGYLQVTFVQCCLSQSYLVFLRYAAKYSPVSYTHLTLPTICSV
eukprot:8144397-Prorocentrum_lima.AAC.1